MPANYPSPTFRITAAMQANKTHKRRWEKEDTLPRKRARQSCEACKARKTKCVGVENGDCEYCKSLNVPCEFNLKNRKRPFYRVSEETYDCLVKLLRRFVSEEELPELTVQTISAYLEQMRSNPPSQISPDGRDRDVEPSDAVSAPNPQDDPQEHDPQELAVPNDNSLFQEELGCMTLDSMGKYRYVGANSSLRWYHAARMVSERPVLSDPRVVIPLKTGLLPPTTPESVTNQHRVEHYLPCHRLSMEYTTRFFAQAHSMHCFYSVEQFYTMLDHTLENRGKTSSASWLCSLYAIFAIGSIRSNGRPTTSDKALPEDIQTPAGYLALAKELIPRVAEDADIESVRAFALLSLAMHSNCYSLEAYLYLGTAARIGFSLGLHRDIFPKTLSTVDRERHRRVWWTVYVLDHEMANRYGYPCAISDDLGFMTTGPASEQILDPSPNMPQGFQALSISLVQLQKKINMDYTESNHTEEVVGQGTSSSALGLHCTPATFAIDRSSPFAVLVISDLNFTSVLVTLATPALKRQRWEAMCILLLALRKAQSAKHQDMLRTCLGTLASMEKVGWCERIVPDIQARVYESGLLDSEAPTGIQDQSLLSDGPGSSEYAEFDFDVSQWDLFQPQGLDSFAQLMNTFPDATFAAGMEHLF
ncbi:Transcription factor [Penicillium cf. griseofulvum]|uniref:Transcription factor n=1 Tax=Penicillium cf. griseofulvum TaxID=2972120 RepID=A0A9W9T5D5_9EURO|nr:Transcription factor [Penicillium cf. griseofulvum]KAJ5421516.1 Transcription factor [Penicillium cf. griseofulvum]KAJ5424750.1 Transcription factor [Penicillium cf. griseofulvum]